MDSSKTMKIIYGDGTLGLSGHRFQYIFSYERGALESLRLAGKEWLYRPIYPTYWRATTDNDRGNGFAYRSAAWLGADLFPQCVGSQLIVDGHHFEHLPQSPLNNAFSDHETAKQVTITFTYQTSTHPQTNVTVTYQVTAGGQMQLTATFHGRDGLPSLPVFGLRMIMPTPVTVFDYRGLSGETYPDRMAGGVPGDYHVDGMPLTPYLVPQEMGMYMRTHRLVMRRQSTLNNADPDTAPFSLTIGELGQPFNFSLLPYTAAELENATHIEELPPVRRSVLVIAGAVRGVGGIDSWGSDVEPAYRLPVDQNYQTRFVINPNGVE